MKQGTGSVKDVITGAETAAALNTSINTALGTTYDTEVVYNTWVTNGVSESRGVAVNAMYWFVYNSTTELTEVMWFDATNTQWSVSSIDMTASALATLINNS